MCGIFKRLDGQTWPNVPITKKKWEHPAKFELFFIVNVVVMWHLKATATQMGPW